MKGDLKMNYLNKLHEQLAEIDLCRDGFILLGAGSIGAMALISMHHMGINVLCFADNNDKKQGKNFEGISVFSPNSAFDIYGDRDIVICVTSPKLQNLIYEQLKNIGFSRLHNIYPIAHYFLENNLFRGLNNDLARDIAMSVASTFPKPSENSGFIINQVEICVTERCTLKCRDCANLMRFYINPKDCDAYITLSSIQKLTEIADYIEQVTILGGEPFLFPSFKEILLEIRKMQNINSIKIITNGSILPEREVFDAIREAGAIVFISYYSELSQCADRLVNECEKHGIICIVAENMEWQNLGSPIEKREFSTNETFQLFNSCVLNGFNTIIGHKLYVCSRAAHMFNCGIKVEADNDSFDLSEKFSDTKTAKNALFQFLNYNNYPSSCEYCNGFSNINKLPLIPAAIQMGGTV